MWTLSLLLSLVVVWLSRCLWRRWKYDLHKIPSPPGLPFVGQTLDLFKGGLEGDISYLLGHWARLTGYPKLYRISLLGQDFVYVRDMNCFKNVLLARAAPLRRTTGEDIAVTAILGKSPGGKGLLFMNGMPPYVKAIRQVYATAFQSRGLKAAFDKLDRIIDLMISQIEAKRHQGPVEFQELCVRMSIDVIGRVAMGANLGGLDGSRELYRLMIAAGRVGIRRSYNPLLRLQARYLPGSETIKEQNKITSALHAEWAKLAEEVLSRDDPPHGEEPIWFGFKKTIDPDTGEPITSRLLAFELSTLVLGGMDPAAHQLAWLLAILASHPHVVELVLEELSSLGLYGADAKKLSFEHLGDMSYLSAVVKEGMRLSCILLHSFIRAATEDVTLMGYRIPKGTNVVGPGNRWANSVEDWGDPDVFRPERWLAGEDMSQKYFLGFAYGPRDCAGQKLALLEIRLAIIRLVTQYRLSLTIPFEQLMREGRQGFSIEAGKGIWINFEPREKVEPFSR